MNIHPILQGLLPALLAKGFSVHSYSGEPNRAPSKSVNLTRPLKVAALASEPDFSSLCVSLRVYLKEDGRAYADLQITLPRMFDLSFTEFSFPHPHFEERLKWIENAALGAAPEILGVMDRGFYEGALERVVTHLQRSEPRRALLTAQHALYLAGASIDSSVDMSALRHGAAMTEFAGNVLDILQADTSWSSDTTDAISQRAFALGLASATGENQNFTRIDSPVLSTPAPI